MHIFLDIKSSGISVKLLYVCVEHFFSDGGSELALGKKNKQKCLVSAFPQFLFLEEQTFCRRVERDVVLKLTTNTEIYCSAVMVWELSMGIWYGYKMVFQTSLNEAEHIWKGRHCSLLNLPFLTLAIFVSRVWIPVELHCSVVRIFWSSSLIRSGETLTHLLKMCEIVGLLSN